MKYLHIIETDSLTYSYIHTCALYAFSLLILSRVSQTHLTVPDFKFTGHVQYSKQTETLSLGPL